jgi:hypothetical protein
MRGVCVNQAKGTNGDFFLEVGKIYEILSEDKIGYFLSEHGWVTKDLISIKEYRENQINQIINDTSLEV